MQKTTITHLPDPSGFTSDPFTDVLRDGARKLIEPAIDAELARLMAACRGIQIGGSTCAASGGSIQAEAAVGTARTLTARADDELLIVPGCSEAMKFSKYYDFKGIKIANRYSSKARAHAVRMVFKHHGYFEPQAGAIAAFTPNIGSFSQNLREWVKRALAGNRGNDQSRYATPRDRIQLRGQTG
jgi:hypothetical protein